MNQLNVNNGTSQRHMTRNIGPSVRILQLNIEGISKSKSEYLARILAEHDVDVVVLQETHAANELQLLSRGQINGYKLIGAIYHHTYGSATYIKSTIENAANISTQSDNNIHLITSAVGDIKIVNTYKPPNIAWPSTMLPVYNNPAIYTGDFNSHHTQWGYSTNDENGTQLVNWADCNNLFLVHDAKDLKTFRSARWRRDYNPDLCFVTKNQQHQPMQTSRYVLNGFPHSQHRPIILTIGAQIPLVNTTPKPRWNFGKANWTNFQKDLDAVIRWIKPISKNYDRFVGAIISTAKKYIPRGYRKEYIPGWTEESDRLYQEFLHRADADIADDLLHSLDVARKEKWINTVENINFSHSSRQAWSLLRKLGGSNSIACSRTSIDPKDIAEQIVRMSKAPSDHQHSKSIKHKLKALKSSCTSPSKYTTPFTIQELDLALAQTKSGKAAGYDGIFPEFLKHAGKNAKLWLTKFFSDILTSGNLPIQFKKTKVIAILKPGKPPDQPNSYRPIALLSVCYKVLERLVYNRIAPIIDTMIPHEQAGFRPNRSCVDQVIALTSYIEAGFQRKEKTGAVFIDLTAAYDTVWREGVVFKLLNLFPCTYTAQLVNNMLSNRKFRVHINNVCSNIYTLKNGLPQGSVLAPLLFNIYMHDLPNTLSKKFGYADDWALAIQHKDISTLERSLSTDLVTFSQYFKQWRLRPNLSKTESTVFHLNNKLANHKLSVYFNEEVINHNYFPKYLGITLDRTLSYKQHLVNTANKLKTRNNIVHKLAGTTWGASPATLRTTALSLVYSAAEYGAPIWLNSSHTHKVDTQLHTTMRIITGTIKSTPLPWLPVLSNIAPPSLRRSLALLREHRKLNSNTALPLHIDYGSHIPQRLKSRKPVFNTAFSLESADFNIRDSWQSSWTDNDLHNRELISNPTEAQPGFNLSRRMWSMLNRIRTNHGRCADSLHKWGITTSSECDCGAPRQTIQHIVAECPLRRYNGHIEDIHVISPEAINWLKSLDINL